jgi:hypothetical protein
VSDIEKELNELRESQDRGKATMENSVSEASLYLQDQVNSLWPRSRAPPRVRVEGWQPSPHQPGDQPWGGGVWSHFSVAVIKYHDEKGLRED